MDSTEIYKNLHKALLEDAKYQQLLGTVKDEKERAQLESFMQRFMNYFQEKVFNPLSEKMEKDEEFKEALAKKVESLIPNKSE